MELKWTEQALEGFRNIRSQHYIIRAKLNGGWDTYTK
ncbi:hypothetical protein X953_06005 [Virgibacillus sp. SK37]|nr:hypothetical protein X953_06005 [Virgibacillus sp. SK37]